jgi:hypothetical protein
MGRLFPGEEQTWQFFDPDERDQKDAEGFAIKPTGWALKVEHDRFAARAIISKSLLIPPDDQEPEVLKLSVLTPEEEEYELPVMTAATEIGRYAVRYWDT